MTQFAVYQNKNVNSRKMFPLLLDIQSNLLDTLQTTVVVPLAKYESHKQKLLGQLTPIVAVEGVDYLMFTPQLAGISKKELGKEVGSLVGHRTEIINAIDFLLVGV